MTLHESDVPFRGWRVWRGIAGQASARPPLVCIPGGPGMPHDYLETLAPLGEERPIVFYDPLGSGRSDRPAGVDWSLALFSEELSVLAASLGVDSLHLFSHSMGSLILLGAIDLPMPRLLSVVMASPIIDVPAYLAEVRARVLPLVPDLEALMRAERDPRLRQTLGYAQLMHQFLERHICRVAPSPACLNRSFRGLNRAAHLQMKGGSLFYVTATAELDLSPRLPSLTMPALITCGEDDLTTPGTCRAFQRLIPNCELAIFPGCTHMPHLEDPARYREQLSRFLRAADPPV